MTSWVQYRIRSKWLTGHLSLVLLTLLRDSELSEWELLESMHRSFGLTPTPKEFISTVRLLQRRGCVEPLPTKQTARLRISSLGLKILSDLEREYRTIVSNLDRRAD